MKQGDPYIKEQNVRILEDKSKEQTAMMLHGVKGTCDFQFEI